MIPIAVPKFYNIAFAYYQYFNSALPGGISALQVQYFFTPLSAELQNSQKRNIIPLLEPSDPFQISDEFKVFGVLANELLHIIFKNFDHVEKTIDKSPS